MRLIDADALKDQIEPYRYAIYGFEGILALIDNAPTIDAIVNTIEYVRRGEWIEHGRNYDSHSHRMFVSCECSACHMYEDFPEDDETGNVLTSHYCKYCGSNMWKEEQE